MVYSKQVHLSEFLRGQKIYSSETKWSVAKLHTYGQYSEEADQTVAKGAETRIICKHHVYMVFFYWISGERLFSFLKWSTKQVNRNKYINKKTLIHIGV